MSLNNEENYFDVGDCCLENPKCMLFAFDRNYVECPENSCIQSNTFCVLEELGDGICKDHNITLLLTVAIVNVKKKTSLMIMMAFYLHISQSADKLK